MTEIVELGPKSLRAIKAIGTGQTQAKLPVPDATLYTVILRGTGTVTWQGIDQKYTKSWDRASYDIYTSPLYLLEEQK